MKKIIKIIAIILGVLVFLFLVFISGISTYTGKSMFEGCFEMISNKTTKENSVKFLEKNNLNIQKDAQAYGAKIEKLNIVSSKHKHTIPADYITIKGTKDNDTMILVHGLGVDRRSIYPIAKIFLEKGYNVLTYDQRNSGDNLAKYTTFGYLESEDLEDCVNFVRSQISFDKKVGILGQSIGGATVGFYSGKKHAKDNVDFVILDSAISNIKYMVETSTSQLNIDMPLPYLMFCGNWATKIKLGFFYSDMDVCKSVVSSGVPTLIIHSKTDKITPYFMASDIYNAIPHSKKRIYTIEKGEHANGFYEDKAKYTKEIMDFINDTVQYHNPIDGIV